MLRASVKRPVTPINLDPENSLLLSEHWSKAVYDSFLAAGPEGCLNFSIEGGSDNGEFPYFDYTTSANPQVQRGDILLDVQMQKVAGFTQRDVVSLFKHCYRNGNSVKIRAVKSGFLTKDLRIFLNTRFQKGSIDHDLQNTIRDNLYQRTVPCTTRISRIGEINGVDYTFLSVEEFINLEQSGSLLESGIYEGNHYGTPMPPKETQHFSPKRSSSIGQPNSMLLPGVHASSEGKRRRNRSNVEAMASKTADSTEFSVPAMSSNTRSSTPVSGFSFLGYQNCNSIATSDSPYCGPASCDLGPLPENWERAYTSSGEPYFIDHNSGTSQWLDPRLSRVQKKAVEDCGDDELPFGWERIDDPHYGTYYIDHVNRRTQYENPVIQARRVSDDVMPADMSTASPWHRRPDTGANTSGSLLIDPRLSGCNSSSLTQTSNCSNNLNDAAVPPASTNNNGNSKVADGGVIGNGNVPTATSNPNSSSVGGEKDERSSSSRFDHGSMGQQSLLRGSGHSEVSSNKMSDISAHNSISKTRPFFTRNPDELRGVFIRTSLLKSARGLGFTIVGGDNTTPTAEEFLQVKDVVPNGPAWCDGKILTGDVLVHVNGECVLGYTHQSIVALFQTISPGESVQLEVCRGYPLQFDPSDPNTKIVTTVAVSVSNTKMSDGHNVYSFRSDNVGNRIAESGGGKVTDSMPRQVKSMPDLSFPENFHASRHNSSGFLNPFREESQNSLNFSGSRSLMPEFLTVEIIKGAAGFGFTIADSSYGQKVKKILDRPRCKQLQENDLLCAINGRDVRTLPHAEVVQLLKDCPCSDAAEIIIQRGGFYSPSKNKGRSKPRQNEELDHYAPGSVFQSSSFNDSQIRINGKTNGSYRSKTPTAELYSSRDKEAVLIARPKTPLVDTRNWPMASAVLSSANGNRRAVRGSNIGSFYSNHKPVDFNQSEDVLECSPERHGNPSWYSDQSRGRDWHNHNFRDFNSHGKEEDSSFSRTFSDNTPDSNVHHMYSSNSLRNSSFEPSQRLLQENGTKFNLRNQNSWKESHGQLEPNMSTSQFQSLTNGDTSSGFYENPSYVTNDESYPVHKSNGNFMHDNSFYKSHMPSYHVQQMSNNIANSFHSMPHNRDNGQFRDGLNDNLILKPYVSSLPLNLPSQSDFFNQRKHTTSFEHEQPVPYNSTDLRTVPHNNPPSVTDVGKSTSLSYIDMTVTLHRQESGFGFRIVGGTEEGSQVAIGHIVPGGAADLDGNLRSGDEIFGVDGQRVINTSHHHVVQLMSNAAENGKVTLHLRRPVITTENSNHKKHFDESFPYDVPVVRNQDEGFGFVIISSVNKSGPTIGRIIEGSPAERCGQLQVGDTILAVNGISIINMHHGDIVNLIKDCGYSATLTIGNPHDDESSIASISQKFEEASLDQDDFYETVFLHRGTKGFGFSIRGGKEFHNMPLFVLRIAENGSAQQDGKIKVGDQIIEINGISTKNMTHAEAIELIRQGGNSVCLLIKRCFHSPGSLE